MPALQIAARSRSAWLTGVHLTPASLLVSPDSARPVTDRLSYFKFEVVKESAYSRIVTGHNEKSFYGTAAAGSREI